MAKKSESNVHVRLNNPIELRKSLLKTAIQSAELLENFESFKEIKAEKQKTELELVKILKSIRAKVTKIRGSLPKSESAEREKPKMEVISPKEVSKYPKRIKKVRTKETNKIERELKNIESKLASLKI